MPWATSSSIACQVSSQGVDLFPVTRTWGPHEVLGYLRTTSFAAPELFAERHQAFDDEALALLHAHAVDGSLVEEATFRVLLAWRPEGAR